jgi:hypothetical protein
MMKRLIFCCLVLFASADFYSTFASSVLVNLNQSEDWLPTHDVRTMQANEHSLTFESIGVDPYITSKALDFSSDTYKAIVIEMSVTDGTQLQVFWATKDAPHFSEPCSHRADLKADGAIHRYTLSLASNPKWRGEITHLRLDPTNANAEVVLQSFQIIDRVGAIIQPIRFSPDVPFAYIGEDLQLTARFVNHGDLGGRIRIRYPAPFSGVKEMDIPAGQEVAVQSPAWTCTEEMASAYQCEWFLIDHQGQALAQKPLSTMIQCIEDRKTPSPLQIQSTDWRAILPVTKMGYGPVRLQSKKDDQWLDLAWISRLATLSVTLNDDTVESYPLFCQALTVLDNGTYRFQDSVTDGDGRKWSWSLALTQVENPSAMRFVYTLQAENGRLAHFSGPELYIGERSFGAKKDMAVFPGIEYLDQDAVSSSDKVARPPVRDQYMPHPYKNTIPFMSLTHQGRMISLLWPPNYEWADGEHTLSPKFAVPNRIYGQENSLFGLFIPPVPNYTLENNEWAHTPFFIQPGETVRMESVVYIAPSDDPADALDVWLRLYNDNQLPPPYDEPRSYNEEIALSRQAYLTSCWHEEETGWGHCVDWKPLKSGGMLALLHLDALITGGQDDRQLLNERIERVYRDLLATRGPVGLGNADGCHVMYFEPAFYWGVVDQILPRWQSQANGMKASQNPDGSWGFHPAKEEQKDLGKEGEVVSGTIGPNAARLLRYARITADPIAMEAGLKGVQAMNLRSVPRGSQGWECPLAAADIMASGYGASANLDAYRITQDTQYLEKAVYWARTGILFHYLWNLEAYPLQRYATIPIFGTTFFTHSWIGVPVQWCGLVYAYALQDLAAFDTSYPWETIATGIIHSAMWQQMTDGKAIGTLPDSYAMYFTKDMPAYINPENIMTPLHKLKGNSLDIRTEFLEIPSASAKRISANADIDVIDKEKYIFSLQSHTGRITTAILCPIATAPKAVRIHSNPVPQSETLFDTDHAWTYLPNQKAVIIRTLHERENVMLEVSFP